MTGPGQPRTCSHSINDRMLTGVCQAVRMFSPCQFQVYTSVGTLESVLHAYYLTNSLTIASY